MKTALPPETPNLGKTDIIYIYIYIYIYRYVVYPCN